MITVGQGLY